MGEFKSRAVIDISVINHLIALSCQDAPGVEKVYALKDGKLDGRYNRFIRTKIEEDGVSTYLVLSPDYSLSQEKTISSIKKLVENELESSLRLKLKDIEILFI